ncbi:MAG: GNAT family N-acetyltransferase [Dinghuibacter sp.]|nr:GNAT family N-acetyltransferase [Dinghuibacter sp.]
MLTYTTSQTTAHLEGIIRLQQRNLARNLEAAEIQEQGFVTVVHRLEDLQRMNAIEQSVIALNETEVVAYVIAMTAASRNDIPILEPMFKLFDEVSFQGKPVSAYRYMVVGQVCVDKSCRGMGVFDACYQLYKKEFAGRYDFAITEIATSNHRSLNAHKRVGFKEIHCYTAPDGEEWSIVVWDWA